MTAIEPELPSWSGVLALTQTQVDAIKADPDVSDAWRALPAQVNAWIGYLGQREIAGEIVYMASSPHLSWGEAELLIEACSSQSARDELKAERAKGGDWKTAARAKTQARVDKKPDAARSKSLADNDARIRPRQVERQRAPLRG